jgi:2-dehydro-3-deoxyphosphogluconate aldolase/(4S)-4-hydroxy-2-oxoglutarate aldolase
MSLLGLRMVHIGINSGGEEEAIKAAGRFAALFGFGVKDGNSSVFAGEGIEIMKQGGRGTHGHIAIRAASVPRATAYLERNGIALDPQSVKRDSKGGMTVIYLKEEILGFAVHLVQ